MPSMPCVLLRVGIASGIVVMDALVAGATLLERTAIGAAPNLAQQLKAAADPGSVLVASSTRELARGLFEYRPISPLALEDGSEPVAAWRVVGAADTDSRFEARRATPAAHC